MSSQVSSSQYDSEFRGLCGAAHRACKILGRAYGCRPEVPAGVEVGSLDLCPEVEGEGRVIFASFSVNDEWFERATVLDGPVPSSKGKVKRFAKLLADEWDSAIEEVRDREFEERLGDFGPAESSGPVPAVPSREEFLAIAA